MDTLPDFTSDDWGVSLPGSQRCHAIGLERGDCRQSRTPGSNYCYYHDKLQQGLTSPSVPMPEDPRDGIALYPVWPLPEDGYVLLSTPSRQLAVA